MGPDAISFEQLDMDVSITILSTQLHLQSWFWTKALPTVHCVGAMDDACSYIETHCLYRNITV